MVMLIGAISAYIIRHMDIMTNLQVALTQKEKNYLKAIIPIRMVVDPDWALFGKLDEKGKFTGIAADYSEIIENRLGIQFEIIPTKNWCEWLAYSKEGKVTAVHFLNKTEEREEWLDFTETLFVDDNVIIGHYNTPYIDEVSLMENKRVVLPKGTSIEERMRRYYQNINITLTETEAEAFEMVSKGEADFTIRSMTVAAYNIRKEGWFDLKVIGRIPEYTNYLRIGILKDEVMLKSILDKAILSITEQERVDILNHHVPLRVENMKKVLQRKKHFRMPIMSYQ